MRLTSVDFPEPVVPRTATVCPGLAVKDTPARMSRALPGYRNETLSKSTLQESGRRVEASGASFTSRGAPRTSKTLWDEAHAREMLAERKPIVRIGKSIKPSRVLKATRSPTESLPPITCQPPNQMIASVPRLANKNTKGKLLENSRTVVRFFSNSSSLTEV